MRSEKGITLVALIGLFVLIVILAGISIAIVGKGNNEVQESENLVVNNLETEYEDQELVVDPTAKPSTDTEVENTLVEDTNVVTEDTTNTVANEVE